MKLVPKSEGYELRDKRSDKSGSCQDWQAQDALYAASESVTKLTAEINGITGTISGMFVAYQVRLSNGETTTCFHAAGDKDYVIAVIERAKGRYMRWENP